MPNVYLKLFIGNKNLSFSCSWQLNRAASAGAAEAHQLCFRSGQSDGFQVLPIFGCMVMASFVLFIGKFSYIWTEFKPSVVTLL